MGRHLLNTYPARRERSRGYVYPRNYYSTTHPISYQQFILQDQPNCYLRLNDIGGPVGTIIKDVSGFNVPAVSAGSIALTYQQASLVNDVSGKSILYPSTACRIQTSGNSIATHSRFSIEFWCNFNGHALVAATYIAITNSAGGNDKTFVWHNTSTLSFKAIELAGPTIEIFSGVLNLNQTNHFVGVLDGTNIILYQNGVAIANAICTTTKSNLTNFGIGNVAGVTPQWNVQEFATYGYDLSPAQVLNHYNKGING